MPDPSQGKAVMEVGSMVVSTKEKSGQMPDPTRGKAVMEVNILNILKMSFFKYMYVRRIIHV